MVPSLPSHLGPQFVSVKLFLSGLFMAKGTTQEKQQTWARPMGEVFPQNWWEEFLHSSDFRNTTTSLSVWTTHPLMFKSILKAWTKHCRTDFLASIFCKVHSKVKNPSIQLLTLTNLLGSTTVRKTLSVVRQNIKSWAKFPQHANQTVDTSPFTARERAVL